MQAFPVRGLVGSLLWLGGRLSGLCGTDSGFVYVGLFPIAINGKVVATGLIVKGLNGDAALSRSTELAE